MIFQPINWPLLLDKVGAPILVGIIVLVGQYFIQPLISERQTMKIERIRSKQTVYAEAVTLVNLLWESIKWENQPKTSKTTPPAGRLVNNCASNLLLLANNKDIPVTFVNLFVRSSIHNALRSEDRLKFINLLREDLYGRRIPDLNLLEDIPLVVDSNEKQNSTPN